jgi:hypothetical protein
MQPCPQIVEHLVRDVNPKRFHYNNSLLAIACGQLNGSFANKSTWSYEMDILARVSLVKKNLTGRTVDDSYGGLVGERIEGALRVARDPPGADALRNGTRGVSLI